jgi:hypothetical protein
MSSTLLKISFNTFLLNILINITLQMYIIRQRILQTVTSVGKLRNYCKIEQCRNATVSMACREI